MKVLYLINFAGKSGTERYVENLVEYLYPEKAQCGLCYGVEGPLANKMRKKNIPTHRVKMRHFFDLIAAKQLADICLQNGYDVIHAQYPRENYIAILSQLFGNRAKIVFTSHLTIHQPVYWRWLNRLFTPKNHRIIAVCNESRGILTENGVAPDRIQVIFNGIDPNAMPQRNRQVLKEFGITEEPVLCILARFVQDKGLFFLCDVMAKLKKKTDLPFRLLMVGDGEEYYPIRDRIRELGLSEHIILTGFREDCGKLMAASDVYLNTSSCNEAMSFAILEALGCGLPVVATNVGGNSDLVNLGGNCGFITDYGNTEDFADRVCQLLEDTSLRSRLSQAAKEKASTVFALDRLLRDVYETYL